MLFADDGKALVPREQFSKAIPSIFSLYVALGLDVKWTKIRGGIAFQWIG